MSITNPKSQTPSAELQPSTRDSAPPSHPPNTLTPKDVTTKPASTPLPSGSEWWEVTCAQATTSNQAVWFEFGGAAKLVARLDRRTPLREFPAKNETSPSLALVTIPAESFGGQDLALVASEWLQAQAPPSPASLMSIQNAQIVWSISKVIIVAPADRLERIAKTMVEVTCFEQQLAAIERDIDEFWSHIERDAPMAFEFRERDVPHREELATRFKALVSLRNRLAKLAPQLLVPQIYPPTLASQIGERFRERMRAVERLDLAERRLESQERIYELCSQRTSEYMIARKGHLLEWIIILVLIAQTLFLVTDYLASNS